jgi:hypothetical protein
MTQAALSEAQHHAAALQADNESLTNDLATERDQTASLKQQVSAAIERAHVSEAHASQMQTIVEHMQSSVSQQVQRAGCYTADDDSDEANDELSGTR